MKKFLLNGAKTAFGYAAAKSSAAAGISECVIGKGSIFEGTLSCAGLLRVEGKCLGRLVVSGTLVVAEGAVVEAEIEADDVIVAGTVRGGIRAKNLIHLMSAARVMGDLKSRKFRLDDGGLYLGDVSRPTE